MSNEQEWRRLQGLYGAMNDDELLRLAADKAELTEVAQQAIDAEMSTRGLELPVEGAEPDIPELQVAEGERSLVALLTTHSAADANLAAECLEAAEIPFQLRPERFRETEDGPWKNTGRLQIVVEADRSEEAVRIVRKETRLLTVAEVEVDERQDAPDDSGDEDLYQVGNFELEADAEVASKALRDANIWFTAERVAVDPTDSSMECTFIEVRFEDMERALEVVEAAFDEAEQ